MPSLPSDLVERLAAIVLDIRETFDADGYTVGSALKKNADFRRSNRPRSELTRGIVGGALQRAALRHGIDYREGKGSADELCEFVDGYLAVMRLKRARSGSDGYRVSANAATVFGGAEEETLIPEVHYALGWILDEVTRELEFFVAEIIGIEPGRPGHFIFGWVHEFVGPTPASGGFQPRDDDDLGDWDSTIDEQDKPA